MRITLALIVILAPSVIGAWGSLHLTIEVPAASFFAARFHLNGDSDLVATFATATCPDDAGTLPQGTGHFVIKDGRSFARSISIGGGVSYYPEGRIVAAGAAGHSFDLDPVWVGIEPLTADSCWTGLVDLKAGHQTVTPALSDATAVFWTTALNKTIHIDATWSKHFVGYDIAVGPIHALKPHEFEQGVGAGLTIPEFDGASVGVGLEEQFSVERDLIGYWWPYAEGSTTGVGDSFCYQNEVACPSLNRSNALRSEGPTTWRFGYGVRDELSYSPHYALVAIELPDDSYLYD